VTMGKLIEKTGDLFTTTAPAIGHGVNVHGVMGHGIAVQFRNRFPEMHEAYKVSCRKKDLTPGTTMIWEPFPGMFVYNIASQDAPGRNARLIWLRDGVEAALSHADGAGLSAVALPRIGAGIGGLAWDDVRSILSEIAESHKADIEVWTLPTTP
jgi:O-acetyl-ADP-ribose deacetylase (regulator of RNase III)